VEAPLSTLVEWNVGVEYHAIAQRNAYRHANEWLGARCAANELESSMTCLTRVL
jgi:hypothetical protein